MGEAIGQLLPLAVGVAVSPLPIVAVVLMLLTERGHLSGPAFLAGWVVGVAGAGAIVLLFASGADASDQGEPAGWIDWLKLLLGLLLLLLSLRQWHGRPHPEEEPVAPRWMGALDRFTPIKAAAAGVVLSALNPKNLLLIVAGGAAIAQTGISAGEQTGAWVLFTVIGSLGVATPVVIYFALDDRSGEILNSLKTWMARSNAVIMAVLLLIIGIKLIGDAIGGLSG